MKSGKNLRIKGKVKMTKAGKDFMWLFCIIFTLLLLTVYVTTASEIILEFY